MAVVPGSEKYSAKKSEFSFFFGGGGGGQATKSQNQKWGIGIFWSHTDRTSRRQPMVSLLKVKLNCEKVSVSRIAKS